MLTIRLARVGRTNLPAYRLVVQEKTRSPRSRVVEILGSYDPKSEPSKIVADKARLDYWLSVGAQPSVPAAELLIKQDLLKVEQAPDLKRERARREHARKRLSERRTWKEQVVKLKKERAEAKQKAQGKPAEAAPAEKPAEVKPAEAPAVPAEKPAAPAEKPAATPAPEKKEEPKQ
ncbi:MAG: 30S ribosomal protein S16 [Candidatus Andersenbacteria bacterium]